MKEFTAWLRRNGRRAFLGELGAGANPTCIDAIHDQLAFLEENADVCISAGRGGRRGRGGGTTSAVDRAASPGADAPMMTPSWRSTW